MLRQSSSRVHRSRGSKVKNVLQICFLVAVSLWLIYQVKHSHDKRKEFVENDASAQVQVQTTRLGRRDLPPQLEETTKNSDPKRDEEDDTEEEEGEDRKHDVEQEIELDGNNSSEEREDAISEHDLEKPDTEDDGEDILEEEKKREENGVQGGTDEDGEKEKVGSSEGHDGNLGGTRNAHEAREELYKADDASSAVTQAIESTNNKTEDLTGKMETDNLQAKTAQEVEGLKEENGEIAENGNVPNVTANGDHGNGTISSKSEEKLLLNSTATVEVVELPERRKNYTEGSLVSDNLSLQNKTDTKLDMNEAQNVTAGGGGGGSGGALGGTSVIVQGQSSGSESNNTQSDSNLLGGGAEAANSTISSEVGEPEKLKPGNGSAELESNSEVSTVEKPQIIVNGTYDSSGTFHAENENLLQVESTTNSSISLEEDKNARADVNLGNLPETNSDDKEKDDPAAAAE